MKLLYPTWLVRAVRLIVSYSELQAVSFDGDTGVAAARVMAIPQISGNKRLTSGSWHPCMWVLERA